MSLTLKRAFSAAILIGTLVTPNAVNAFSLQGTVWSEAAGVVDPQLLYAVALAESKKVVNGQVRPWPWTVNTNGKGYYFDTRDEAETFVDNLVAKGVKSIDVGPLQINLRWNGHRVKNHNDLFDLPTAVRVGADILKEAMNSSPNDKALAVGRYHNWQDDRRARNYGVKVLQYFDVIAKAGGRRS